MSDQRQEGDERLWDEAETVTEKLLAWAKVLEIPSGSFVNDDLREAASRISALEEENKRLREALNEIEALAQCERDTYLELTIRRIRRARELVEGK